MTNNTKLDLRRIGSLRVVTVKMNGTNLKALCHPSKEAF